MWVPKKGFFLRPGSIPHLDDRIIFQGIVDKIANILESQLPPLSDGVVFSSRLNQIENKEKMFIHPKGLWLSFKKRSIEFCRDGNYKFVLVSDIANYFENIDLRMMTDTLQSIGVQPDYVLSINHFLSVWANGRTKGLPQMLAPSSLLANIYLSQVDKNITMKGYPYIRYVDDIRIFVKRETDLRKALLDLTEQLKLIYLDVQANKTRLMKTSVLEKEILKLEKHLLESGIELDEDTDQSYQIRRHTERNDDSPPVEVSQSEEDNQMDEYSSENFIPEEKLVSFLDKILESKKYDDRHLRFCLNNLAKIKSRAGVDVTISHLASMPQETATFVNYLLRIDKSFIEREHISKILIFFESDYCIYDWQIMWLLILLINTEIIDNTDLFRMFRIDIIQKHFINRALLYYLLSLKGDLSLKREIMSRFSSESSIEVRMAILSGIFHLDLRERNRFYSLATQELPINKLIAILKNRECPFA